jgi:hypothetical protein
MQTHKTVPCAYLFLHGDEAALDIAAVRLSRDPCVLSLNRIPGPDRLIVMVAADKDAIEEKLRELAADSAAFAVSVQCSPVFHPYQQWRLRE